MLPTERQGIPLVPFHTCRRCYEVKCDPRKFTDGYGAVLDRSTVCYNANASVVIQIVVGGPTCLEGTPGCRASQWPTTLQLCGFR